MKTALVTGAAGFLGRHVVPKLQAAGYQVTGVDPRYQPWPVRFEDLDFGSESFDVVIHLAANIEDVNERMKRNISNYQDLTLDYQMAHYLWLHPPKECAVWPSSCVIDNLKDPYAWVKKTAEQYCLALAGSGVRVIILRPFSGYGFSQALSYPFPAIFARALAHENPLTFWGSGLQIRDWIHVDDLARAFVHAIAHFPAGTPIDIGTGEGTSIARLTRMIAEQVGYDPELKADQSKPESSEARIADTLVATLNGFEAKISVAEGIADYISKTRFVSLQTGRSSVTFKP